MLDSTQKIDTLTGVRAYAALWVVLLHFRANEGIAGTINFDWLAARGFWGVDVFFVLSGFILTHTYYRTFNSPDFNLSVFKLFLVKRLARIYPLHLVTFLVFLGLALWGAYSGREIVNGARCGWEAVLPNLLLLHAWGTTAALSWNYPSWSISAEWFAYLALVVVGARILWRNKLAHSYRAVVFSWLAICLWAGLQGYGVDHYTTTGVLRIIPEFLAGCLLYRLAKDGVARKHRELLFTTGVIGMLALGSLSRNFEFLLLPLIGALLLGLFHQSRLGSASCGNRAAIFLGEISYSIYLTHPFAQMLGDSLVKSLALPDGELIAWLILATELLLVIAFGAVGYYIVERPLRRAIVHLFEKRSHPTQSRVSVHIHRS